MKGLENYLEPQINHAIPPSDRQPTTCTSIYSLIEVSPRVEEIKASYRLSHKNHTATNGAELYPLSPLTEL
ncbi:hypothetical protein J6590_100588 [Homalodisca vitripennis]|nr:hypothetical protein J6590_100588 [Homalodisca vitripennis]